MPVKRIKDMSKCVAQWKLKSDERPFYWHVYLWEDEDSMLKNTAGLDLHDGNTAQACHCPGPTTVDIDTGQLVPDPKLGEIHFIKDKWSLEIVVHELQHALFHRIRTLCSPGLKDLDEGDMGKEEPICYEMGRWAGVLYRMLWNENPNTGWKMVT